MHYACLIPQERHHLQASLVKGGREGGGEGYALCMSHSLETTPSLNVPS